MNTTTKMVIVGSFVIGGLTYYVMQPSQDPADPTEANTSGRQRVLQLARADVGKAMQNVVWVDVNPQLVGLKSWCGAWVLHILRAAGLTDVKWTMGKGFIGPLGLHMTAHPQPGDIAYWDRPSQHHAIVEQVDPLITLDGAATGNVVARVTSARPKPVYYSIESLLT